MNLKKSFRAWVFLATCIVSVVVLAEPFFTDDFMGTKTKWETRQKYGRGLKIEFGARGRNFSGLIVSSSQKELDNKNPDASDTCWGVRTPPIPLPKDRKPYLLVSFDIAPDLDLEATREGCHGAYNAIIWYDADGKEVQYVTMRFRAKAGDFRTIRQTARIPADARSVSVQVGFGEDLYEGVSVAYKNLKVDTTDSSIPPIGRLDRGDFRPPKVRMLSASPTWDAALRPSFRVTDETGVDWKTLKVEIDGTNVTERFTREGDVVTWSGTANWSAGYHPMNVTIADTKGQSYRHRRCFYIGATPQVPKISLRDDGITLVDDKPFFPIGIFGVRLMYGHNGNSYDAAIRELKEAGFNMVHAYGECREPGFVTAAKKYGMWMWTNEELPRWEFREQERFWPHVIAWYTGDDTSGHQKPWENDDYDEINRALDPNRITCQADGVRSDAEYSAYHDYVTTTDVFMPEIYPLVRDTPQESRECVSRVIRDMKRVADDIREAKDARHHGVWPIIQAFDRAGWKHYPTREELFAMTFAALCHGATGMTWYNYDCQCGVKNVPEEFPEEFSGRWADLTELSKRIGELQSVLVERQTVRDKAKVVVRRGPQQDLYGYPSISTRMHHKDGVAYLIAVNSSAAEVEVGFTTDVRGVAEVLHEGRTLVVPAGSFVDVFKPLGVHVYRIKGAVQ